MQLRLIKYIGVLVMIGTGPALADTDPRAGRVVAEHEGREIELPLLRSDLAVNIEGDMATVEIRQVFENPSPLALNAEYLFPLNQSAAIYGMEMHVGDEIVQAVIRKKEEAQAEFDAAQQNGQAAALLTQHRPNMFTQNIANLMPGQPIEVRLRYVQMVPKVEGSYQLVVPLIVGPRYQGANAQPDRVATLDPVPLGPEAQPNTWSVAPLPDYPQVAGLDLPRGVTGDRVSLDLTLTSGVTLGAFDSPTHPLRVVRDEDGLTAEFVKGRVMDNKDLILEYQLQGDEVQTAAISHRDERGGFVSVMIEPPALPDEASVTPRELIFVLDTSGSMGGAPMEASKRFMRAALAGLRPQDYFRIIPFSNTAQQMSLQALPATAANLRAGRSYVDRLGTGGGTEIDNAIRAAFTTAQPEDTMRIVVFLSDGYIGDEAQVLRTINAQIGAARIYAFGVGSSVNRYLLDGMAEEGRGYARYVGLDEDALEAAETLARDLKSPLLTDIEVDWGDLAVTGVSPARVPDLFAGSSVRVYARHDATGPAQITVRGRVNGRPAEMQVPITLTDGAAEPALPLVWARSRIARLERAVVLREDPAASDAQITRLGLDFSLQTRNTSFVAVSQKVVNDGTPAVDSNVPLPMVEGVGPDAYPQAVPGSTPTIRTRAARAPGQAAPTMSRLYNGGRYDNAEEARIAGLVDIAPAPTLSGPVGAPQPLASKAPSFAGSSTPEPEMTLGLLVLAALSALGLWRRRAKA